MRTRLGLLTLVTLGIVFIVPAVVSAVEMSDKANAMCTKPVDRGDYREEYSESSAKYPAERSELDGFFRIANLYGKQCHEQTEDGTIIVKGECTAPSVCAAKQCLDAKKEFVSCELVEKKVETTGSCALGTEAACTSNPGSSTIAPAPSLIESGTPAGGLGGTRIDPYEKGFLPQRADSGIQVEKQVETASRSKSFWDNWFGREEGETGQTVETPATHVDADGARSLELKDEDMFPRELGKLDAERIPTGVPFSANTFTRGESVSDAQSNPVVSLWRSTKETASNAWSATKETVTDWFRPTTAENVKSGADNFGIRGEMTSPSSVAWSESPVSDVAADNVALNLERDIVAARERIGAYEVHRDKVVAETESSWWLSFDCPAFIYCSTVTENGVTMPRSEYEERVDYLIQMEQEDAKKLEGVVKFIKSDDPLAERVSIAIAEGGGRAGAVVDHVSRIAEVRERADTYGGSPSPERIAQERTAIENILSGTGLPSSDRTEMSYSLTRTEGVPGIFYDTPNAVGHAARAEKPIANTKLQWASPDEEKRWDVKPTEEKLLPFDQIGPAKRWVPVRPAADWPITSISGAEGFEARTGPSTPQYPSDLPLVLTKDEMSTRITGPYGAPVIDDGLVAPTRRGAEGFEARAETGTNYGYTASDVSVPTLEGEYSGATNYQPQAPVDAQVGVVGDTTGQGALQPQGQQAQDPLPTVSNLWNSLRNGATGLLNNETFVKALGPVLGMLGRSGGGSQQGGAQNNTNTNQRQPNAVVPPQQNATTTQNRPPAEPNAYAAIVANPSSVKAGETAVVAWASVRTTKCSVYGEGDSLLKTAGPTDKVTTPAITKETLFTVKCATERGGEVLATTSVKILQ